MTLNNILIQIGPVTFYTKATGHYNGIMTPSNSVYWCDKHDIQEHGPFPSLFVAGQDYANARRALQKSAINYPELMAPIYNKPKILKEGRLIKLDFKTKKRIS